MEQDGVLGMQAGGQLQQHEHDADGPRITLWVLGSHRAPVCKTLAWLRLAAVDPFGAG